VPTCAFTLAGKSHRQVAEELDEANIFVWDGNYYALEVTTRLGLEENGGMVRVGPVHYNTLVEIRRFGEALGRITAGVTIAVGLPVTRQPPHRSRRAELSHRALQENSHSVAA
jgi:hypothetical protein